MVTTKVSAKLQSLFNRQIRKVLVPECNHTTLRHKECEIVLAGVGERRKLDTAHFSAELRSEVFELGYTLGEEVREGRVSGGSMFGVLVGGKRIVAMRKKRIESVYGDCQVLILERDTHTPPFSSGPVSFHVGR